MGYRLQRVLEWGNHNVLLLLYFLLADLLSMQFQSSLVGLIIAGVASLISFLLLSLKLYPIFGLAALLVQRGFSLSSGFGIMRIIFLDKFALLLGSVLALMATFPFTEGHEHCCQGGRAQKPWPVGIWLYQ